MNRFVFLFSLFSALLVLAMIGGLVGVLSFAAAPAFSAFGFSFFESASWNPVTEKFGALAALYGTLASSLIALLLALPVGGGIAFFLTDIASPRLVRPLRIAIELLAGIPSIVYGFWGLFVLAPLFQDKIQPFLAEALGDMPGIGVFFQGPRFGVGLLTSGCVLAVMVLPFLAATMTDMFKTVSPTLKESAFALGCTRFEVWRDIVGPSTLKSLVGAVMLAFGRALGETMAVTFVVGNAHRFSLSLLTPGTTLAASIANEFNEATGSLHTSSLLALGLTLFLLTFVVLALGRALLFLYARKGAAV